ncbi:Uncharacterized protein PECH_008109 [Penicillium ucsense]|uniref:Iron-sulfur assembly protein 1 n=1 Tax=Penicillium ucsense TaxID=2839758 RepID=A0A8J8W8D9_9EURO|nr:Uncharacterized protein PECM_003338 [Penicillium ucsense]KAF7738742.1 Uncharacterized protein PECH_008109 [Penicillium ucsense]
MPRPVTSSATLLRWMQASAVQRGAQSMRCFSSAGSSYMSSKRDMQTATAYRPHTLPSSFPTTFPKPSGGAGSDLSITADFPLPSGPAKNGSTSSSATTPQPEREAHVTKPVSNTSTTTNGATKTSKPRRPLRARKAAMKLTPLATVQLRKLMDQPDPKFIRVGVKNRGCSGLAYHLEYVEKPGKFDEIVEQDGVKVLIDSKALFSIIGSEMDWHEDPLSQRFVFRNPNIKEECGCGESFMV